MGNFTSKWSANQNVQISDFAYSMLVTSKQSGSTPGIMKENIEVQEEGIYVFSIAGKKIRDVEGTNDFSVFPYIRDSDTFDSIYDQENKDNLVIYTAEELSFEEFPMQIIVKIPKCTKKVDIFLLFKDQEIGSQFIAEALSFDKIDIDPSEIPMDEEFYFNNPKVITTHFGPWSPNQEITHKYNGVLLHVIANQNTSTPGIRCRDLTVIPGEKYTFSFLGKKGDNDYGVFPYISDALTGLSIFSPYDKRHVVVGTPMEFGTDLTKIKVTVKIPEGVTKIQAYLLFVNPYVGAEYFLHYFSFYMASDLDFSLTELENKVQNNDLLSYADKSVGEGELVYLYTSCTRKPNLNYIKFVILDINKDIIKVSNSPNIIFQDYPEDGAMVGCNWINTHIMDLDIEIDSGMYFICALYGDNYTFMPLVVRNTNSTYNKILVLNNINTWAAYESWAGYNNDQISLHRWNTDKESEFRDKDNNVSIQVSFNRPFLNASEEIRQYLINETRTHKIHSHTAYLELWLYNFLEENNIHYDIINDQDLDGSSARKLYSNYDMLIIHGHSQYWTDNAVTNLSKMAKNGVNLALFGAGAFHWKAHYINGNLRVIKNGDVELIKNDDDDLDIGLWSNIDVPEHFIHPKLLFGISHNPDKHKNGASAKYQKYIEHYVFRGADWSFGGYTLSANYNMLSGWIVDDVTNIHNKRNTIAGATRGGKMVYNNGNFFRSFASGTLLWNSALLVDHSVANITLNIIKEFSNSKVIMFRRSPINVTTKHMYFDRNPSNNILTIDYLGKNILSNKLIPLRNNYYFQVDKGHKLNYNGHEFIFTHYYFNNPSEHLLNDAVYPMSVNLIHESPSRDTFVVLSFFIGHGKNVGLDSSIALEDERTIYLPPTLNNETIHTYPGTLINEIYTGSATWVIFGQELTSSVISQWPSNKGIPADIQRCDPSQDIVTYRKMT